MNPRGKATQSALARDRKVLAKELLPIRHPSAPWLVVGQATPRR